MNRPICDRASAWFCCCLVAALLSEPAMGQDTRDSVVLDLNLPSFTLELRNRDSVLQRIRVAVGRRAYPTPVGVYAIDYLVWNPPWTPPDKPWARNEVPQPPGPRNWMGRVKLHVVDLVFLHGSPFVKSFGSAASHACVRLPNEAAIGLARTLTERNGVGVTPALIDSLVANSARTYQVLLRPSIPITIRYELAAVRGDSLVVYPDIYPARPGNQRSHVVAALAAHGLDTSRISSERLRMLLLRARRARSAASLAELQDLTPARQRPDSAAPHSSVGCEQPSWAP
jgi:murein L,D-transpeptidase YcbB/YkuD